MKSEYHKIYVFRSNLVADLDKEKYGHKTTPYSFRQSLAFPTGRNRTKKTKKYHEQTIKYQRDYSI